jgi:hypothetical protein
VIWSMTLSVVPPVLEGPEGVEIRSVEVAE